MNFLAHLYLADGTEASLVGNFMGDFVKGPLEDLERRHGPEVVRGLITHRKVDAFTDSHPEFLAAKRLVSPARRRFAGIIVDLSFDHFLARDWSRYADSDLDAFVRGVYAVFRRNLDRFPVASRAIVDRMIAQDWLGAYRTIDGLGAIMNRMAARRLRRGGDRFAGAVEELESNYAALEARFERFFPEVVGYVEGMGGTTEGTGMRDEG